MQEFFETNKLALEVSRPPKLIRWREKMNKSKEFLEFVRPNSPPYYPGDKFFGFDAENGKN